MRVAAVQLRPYALPLVREWSGSSAAMGVRAGMLVAVNTCGGVTGWGDCAPLPSASESSRARVFDRLIAAAGYLAGREIDAILDELRCEPCAQVRWALETALLDAKARSQDIALSRMLAGHASKQVAVNAALGPLDEGCASRAEIALAEGFSVAKIKVGLGGLEREIELLRQVVWRTDGLLRLRLDANRAWTRPEAQRILGRIADLPIDGVEEPLAEPSVAALADLQAQLPFALAVDESLPLLGANVLFDQRPVGRLVVKPARIGGFAAVLQLAARAEAAGIEVIITSVIDSAVGVTAAAHLAAALPRESVHGLATLAWLTRDVARGPTIEAGIMVLPPGSGLGIAPCDDPAQCGPVGLAAGQGR
jgi:o-succinylbenzoate synthase